jgi:serine/threonine protein kinase
MFVDVRHFTNIFHYGKHHNYKCLVMELLGTRFDYFYLNFILVSVLELLVRMPWKKFSLITVINFGIQSLQALQSLHKRGFIHRDIKIVC